MIAIVIAIFFDRDLDNPALNGSKIWALLADETMDRQTREILVLVCRYTYHEKGQIVIREDPFAIVDAFEKARAQNQSERNELKLDGKTLGHVILSQLRKATLDTSICVGQGYDGAATMAGVANGVAAEIMKTVWRFAMKREWATWLSPRNETVLN